MVGCQWEKVTQVYPVSPSCISKKKRRKQALRKVSTATGTVHVCPAHLMQMKRGTKKVSEYIASPA